MARYSVLTTTTESVSGSGGSLDFELDLPANAVDLYKIKIAPSSTGETSIFSIFKTPDRDPEDLIYKTKPWDDTEYYDPIEDNAGVYSERAEGFVCRYEDTEEAGKLYCTIVNNKGTARTYDIEISIDISPFSPNAIGVPDVLTATATANGLLVTSKVIAAVNNATIDKADFRAILIAPGESLPISVDLRITSEGGTFSHNGTTQLVIDDLPANSGGATYSWTSNGEGRWYYAWRLRNTSGWSNWTDGNEDPSTVTQWVETSGNTDTGPPDDWQITVENGTKENTVIVHFTRPKTNGNVIKGFGIQLKDTSTGSWRALDADTGAAETHYDGSAANHTLDPVTGLFGNGGGGWDDAEVGDFLLFDVRGNESWGITYVFGDIVKTITDSTIELYTNVLPLPTASMGGGKYNKIRLKIVKPPWNWNSEGYMGGWVSSGGWWTPDMAQFQRFSLPDFTTQEFVSDPIPVNPSAVNIAARVFIINGYSMSDGNIISSTGVVGGNGVLDGYLWTNFGDRNWWAPTCDNGANVLLEILPGGYIKGTTIAASNIHIPGFAGAAGRFRVLPATDGEIVVRIQFTVDQFTLPAGIGNTRGSAVGMFLDLPGINTIYTSQDIGCHGFAAVNRDSGSSTHALRVTGVRGLSGDNGWNEVYNYITAASTDSRFIDEIAMPTRPFDIQLRLTISEDTTNLGAGCMVWKKYEYQINSDGWVEIMTSHHDIDRYDRRATATAIRGYVPVIGYFQDPAMIGDNATLKQFQVVKGLVVRF